MKGATIEQHLKEPSSLVDRVNPSKVVFSYDHNSDTLVIHLHGRGRPGVSVPVIRGWMLRLDRETDELIGIQIEGVLASAARARPSLLGVLDLADLRGITPDEIDWVRREVAAPLPQDALRCVLEGLPMPTLAAD